MTSEDDRTLPAALAQELQRRCEEHAHLKRQIAAMDHRAETLAQEVDAVMAQAGYGDWLLEGLVVAGHRMTLVAGETSRINLEKLVRLGCDPAWLTQATETVPRKVHVRFLHPKE